MPVLHVLERITHDPAIALITWRINKWFEARKVTPNTDEETKVEYGLILDQNGNKIRITKTDHKTRKASNRS